MTTDKCEYCRKNRKTVMWTEKFGRLCERCSVRYESGDIKIAKAERDLTTFRRQLNRLSLARNSHSDIIITNNRRGIS